jgi:dihydropteroate synthase
MTRLPAPDPQPSRFWHCRNRRIELGQATLVMGILNITPDSFSDGGRHFSASAALAGAERLVREGADILDVGGESTRPGSEPVPAEEEMARILPVVAAIRRTLDCPISIDTYKAAVAAAALDAGADIINDISGLTFDPGMAGLAAETGAGVVIMHILGTPRDMQTDPHYEDVTGEIAEFLARQVTLAERAGVSRDQIVIDPGIGFGKRLADNFTILRELDRLTRLGLPVLAGPSRKSFIGRILDLPVEERLEGTAAAVTAAILNGARIVRVHDVQAMKRVARIADAIRTGPNPG